MKVVKFLDLIGSKLKEDRPNVPDTNNYTVEQHGDVVNFWFRTQGCKYTKNGFGGCLMCDYSVSSQPSSHELISYIRNGLNQIKDSPSILLINSSGSFFDTNEVPENVRIEVYNNLSKYTNIEIIIETLLETITEDKLIEIRKILNKQTISIEFGLESIDPLVLKYSVNKKINLECLQPKLNLINKYNINSVANILIGNPFLSEEDIINDSVKTIKDMFDMNISYVVLFPVNIKQYTTVHWLYENNLYNQISLWSYIEVISKVDKEYLNRIELSWYKNRKPNNPLYKKSFKTPTTCPKCYDKVISLLDEFSVNKNSRIQILNNLKDMKCECKNIWGKSLNNKTDFKENIKKSYKKMGQDLLGKEFWGINETLIYNEVDNDFCL